MCSQLSAHTLLKRRDTQAPYDQVCHVTAAWPCFGAPGAVDVSYCDCHWQGHRMPSSADICSIYVVYIYRPHTRAGAFTSATAFWHIVCCAAPPPRFGPCRTAQQSTALCRLTRSASRQMSGARCEARPGSGWGTGAARQQQPAQHSGALSASRSSHPVCSKAVMCSSMPDSVSAEVSPVSTWSHKPNRQEGQCT